jgi:hypothetical protein
MNKRYTIRPGQELLPKEDNLPTTSSPNTFINRVVRTLYGARRQTDLANAHTELFEAFAKAEEAFARLATTEHRMREEFERDTQHHNVAMSKLKAEQLVHDIAQERLEFERANLQLLHELERARIEAEIRGFEKKNQPAPESDLSDDPKVRQVQTALKRQDEIVKLKPEFDRRRKEVERQRNAGEISDETASSLMRYYDDMFNQLIKP